MSNEIRSVYSYHTFIFPFTWVGEGNSYNNFVRYFETNMYWTSNDMDDTNAIDSVDNVRTEEEKLTLYQEYQYFYPYARKAIYGFDEKIVRNYSFMYDRIHNKATYSIQKGEKTYQLSINDIRLKVFNTNVALFIMECENFEHRDPESVKDINDYGRRITLPFFPNDVKSGITADTLTVRIDDELTFISDFKGFIETGDKTISMNHTADFIKDILDFGGIKGGTFSSHRVKEPDRFRINPLLGDRMFVLSLICDEKWAKVCDQNKNGLYELVFVDHGGGYSCANDTMRDELLEMASYERWTGYDSYYFITEYSFIFLTDGGSDFTIKSFITQYFQMFCLAIAQRASVAGFKKEIAGISALFENKRPGIKESDCNRRIAEIAERYIAFESQLYFDEVSPEQQGIEIYDLMKERLRLKEEVQSLKDQVDSLYNVANIRNENKTNNYMSALTWVAFVVSLASMFISSFQIRDFEESFFGGSRSSFVRWIILGTMLLALAVSWWFIWRAKRKNQ